MSKEAIEHYEAALKEAFPSGARGDVFHHWNEARKALADQPAPMSQPNRVIAYSATTKLRELGYEWVDGEWKQPAQQEQESWEDLHNALQRIDTAAVGLPTFEVRHEGGLDAVTQNIVDAITALHTQPAQQEPVAWVYSEGLEALKNGKPWTAYGTKQEANNIALYLHPTPECEPYAWVTFTPYGDEDDVWYENPEGQLLEGWTYKPLYDTAPPRREWVDLTDDEIDVMANDFEEGYVFLYRSFTRAIEAKLRERNT